VRERERFLVIGVGVGSSNFQRNRWHECSWRPKLFSRTRHAGRIDFHERTGNLKTGASKSKGSISGRQLYSLVPRCSQIFENTLKEEKKKKKLPKQEERKAVGPPPHPHTHPHHTSPSKHTQNTPPPHITLETHTDCEIRQEMHLQKRISYLRLSVFFFFGSRPVPRLLLSQNKY